jgi:hypothetical protein
MRNKASILRFFFAVFAAVTLVSCVSVNIGDNSKSMKSETVTFRAPAAPFTTFKTDYVDSAWKNSKNGNSISFLSECNSSADPSLETIYQGLISSINRARSLNKKSYTFNNREALRSTVSGYVDGVQSQFDLIVFKKNNCTYILSYVATEKNFSENLSAFDTFAENFVVP